MARYRSVTGVRRGAEVTFTFNGQPFTGHEGDTIAGALMMSGVLSQRVSPRDYSRRGYYCGMGQCWECAVHITGLGVVRSCMEPLVAGIVVHSADEDI